MSQSSVHRLGWVSIGISISTRSHFKIDETEVDADLVGSMADTVFGVMEIPESEQDMDHEKWVARKA